MITGLKPLFKKWVCFSGVKEKIVKTCYNLAAGILSEARQDSTEESYYSNNQS
jgi:hypothetical protein